MEEIQEFHTGRSHIFHILDGDADRGTPKTLELQRQKNSNDNRTPIF